MLKLAQQPGETGDESDLLKTDGLQRIFGDYELLAMIGRGGMGLVYKARQISLPRNVALKMIRSPLLASEIDIHRFLNEAKAAAMLKHPNIVPINAVGEHEGQQYIDMLLIEGGNLAQRLLQDKSSESAESLRTQIRNPKTYVLVRLLSKVARAVHYAHQRGILHRDLKPSNILIDLEGEPHVADFGLAKLMDENLGITATKDWLGTREYMSPEQGVGAASQLTIATDVYSLGVILYEMLTGRVPFQGSNAYQTIRLVIEAAPEVPSSINPRIDRDLDTICLKCLGKEPERRYPSAAELADDLDRWVQNKPITARRAPGWEIALKWVRREPLKAGLLALCAIAVAGPLITARFYLRTLPHMATEHPVVTYDREGIYWLRLGDRFKEDRCTENFWRGPMEQTNRLMRLEFTNVPAELLSRLRCVIRADIAGRPDPARTPVVTNGQTFWLKMESELDRDFYVASVGWNASNILTTASNATVKLTILK